MTDTDLDRRALVAQLLARRDDALVVTGLGAPSWDAAAAGDRDDNFSLWGGMGGAAMTGLGLALAQPGRRVLVITGDGEQLMGLGALATIGAAQPGNLCIAVIDNERYGETGMQSSHTGRGVDLAAVALACGFDAAETGYSKDAVNDAADRLLRAAGPRLAVFKVRAGNHPLVLPPRDGPWLKNRFRRAVTGEPCDG